MDIRVEDVSYAYGSRQALSGLTWHVRPGITGLLGPNGAGKTTLLSLLVTLNRVRTGTVLVGDHDVSDPAGRRAARRVIGYLPERFSLVAGMRVGDAVAYAAWLNGVSYGECFPAARRALARIGLAERERSRVRELSGGMRQRLGIAAALAHDPAVVIMDEPTVGLDPSQRLRLREVIHEIGRDRTVVLSTHLVEDVAHLCDEVAIIDEGRMRFSGPAHALTAMIDDASGGGGRGSKLERAYDHFLRYGWPGG
ncbi:ABC-2 type transport system ATP-binding protein [Prauserella shujinwangii]|uniref:ABC-2 type transport system ATP-binding protein n=1 Tax=Prauserella shujinwangii TaxID=1453103 RepID=A0A2T0M1C5_9PSEU|nr:ATP-binding cassette domain-containing protein [Prauserella shujinwangii]PRX50383.1 ABC-2 type transport system ATP-binding protein [Prauserella shujinwangii]